MAFHLRGKSSVVRRFMVRVFLAMVRVLVNMVCMFGMVVLFMIHILSRLSARLTQGVFRVLISRASMMSRMGTRIAVQKRTGSRKTGSLLKPPERGSG